MEAKGVYFHQYHYPTLIMHVMYQLILFVVLRLTSLTIEPRYSSVILEHTREMRAFRAWLKGM